MNDTLPVLVRWRFDPRAGRFIAVPVRLVRRSTKGRSVTRLPEEMDSIGGRVGIAASTLNIEKVVPLEVPLTRGTL